MIDYRYLAAGVRGLMNAHRAGTMAGHLGAAVAAGYFFGEDASGEGAAGLLEGPLPGAVARGVEAELDRVVAGEEAIWFNAQKAGLTPGDLFEGDFGNGEAAGGCDAITEALMTAGGALRQSGHNVIFASIAVRALKDHPQFATQAVVDGVCKLMRAFKDQAEGRGFYGKKAGWKSGQDVDLSGTPEPPAYDTFEGLADAILRELPATAGVRKQGFGGLWHLTNHAAAVIELARYGYRAEAVSLIPAHRHHLHLWHSLPDVEAQLGPVVTADQSPWTPAYWDGPLKRDGARLTHRIKTLYGYQIVRATGSPELRPAADRAFLSLMD